MITFSRCHVQLSRVDRVQIYGPPPSRPRAALCAFNVEGVHATDLSMFLDQDGMSAVLKRSAASYCFRLPWPAHLLSAAAMPAQPLPIPCWIC